MAPWLVPEMSGWNRRGLTFPPNSWRTWVRLAVWEFWIGMLVCGAVAFGVQQIASAPDQIVTFNSFVTCADAERAAGPCERVYRTGGLNALFTFMVGVLLLIVAAWLLWELWMAVKPRPIADDFLKLLHDSFARDWRNPLTWPWVRLAWAYGFAMLGASSLAAVVFLLWSLASVSTTARPLRVDVHTSESFVIQQSP
jgi:hypothetical protein